MERVGIQGWRHKDKCDPVADLQGHSPPNAQLTAITLLQSNDNVCEAPREPEALLCLSEEEFTRNGIGAGPHFAGRREKRTPGNRPCHLFEGSYIFPPGL